MDALGIRLTRTPATALAGLLRSVQTPTVRGLDFLSAVSGVQERDIAAIVRRERVVTRADSDELAAIATAGGSPLSALSYGTIMVRAAGEVPDEEEDEAEDKPARYRFTMSTADVDRARDIVGQTWDLRAFRANPVGPWGHRSDMPPVGVWEGVGLAKGRLVGEFVPAPVASYDLSMTVAAYLKAGVLRTVSVGFLPGEAIPRSVIDESDPRHAARGLYFDKNELLECSIVTVPMNAGALAEMPMAAPEDEDEPEDKGAHVEPDPFGWLTVTREGPPPCRLF